MNEVNKIIGRDFIIGFFVPAILLVGGSAGLLHAFGILPEWLKIDPEDPLKDSTFLALITILTAFFLMAANRIVFRTLEGYWVFDLGRHLNYIQRLRFRRLRRRIAELDKEYEQCLADKKEFKKIAARDKLLLRAAQRFPSTEDQVMFTSFGNAVRAFEDYPRVLYGFESINGWSRLSAVMPKAYRETLGSRRATTDFWVNVWFVGLLVLCAYAAIAGRSRTGLEHREIPIAAIGLAFFASQQARIAAEQWGEWVKAGFDMYLPAVREKWGFVRPHNMEAERKFWNTLSQAIVYRDAGALDDLEGLRKAGPPLKKPSAPGAEEEPEEED